MADKTPMIDTSLLTDYFRKTDKAKTRLVQISQQFSHLAISSVTEFEIYSGATPVQLSFWQELLKEVAVLPFDSKAAHIAAGIQQILKKAGKIIDKPDLFIAATAIANNLTLDTLNRKHFNRIEQFSFPDVSPTAEKTSIESLSWGRIGFTIKTRRVPADVILWCKTLLREN